VIRPQDIVIAAASGRQSMAASFGLAERFVLVSLRGHFSRESGTGGETANLTLDVQSKRGTVHNARLATFVGVGINADLVASIPECDARKKYMFDSGDKALLTWTSPDSDEILWGIEVGMVPARLIE